MGPVTLVKPGIDAEELRTTAAEPSCLATAQAEDTTGVTVYPGKGFLGLGEALAEGLGFLSLSEPPVKGSTLCLQASQASIRSLQLSKPQSSPQENEQWILGSESGDVNRRRDSDIQGG